LWERGTLGICLFCQVSRAEATPITTAKSASIFYCPSTKSQGTSALPQALPTKGNSNKNVKKKEHNDDKREVLQAHAIQVQTLQNELESLRAQLANLKGKSCQLVSHAQPVQGSGSREGPPRSFYGLPHDAMVGEYVLSTPRNSSLTPKLATSFCPSYVVAQEASVTPRVSATRQVIQTDGLTSGSSPITRARGARAIMPQSFRPLNMEKERTLLARGEETTTPQAVRASNSRVPGVHVHQENTQFSTNQLMECQLQMHEVAQKLVSTPLFSFQDLKLSTKDIITILEDTLNTTLGPLPIFDPHAIEVPSNTLEKHSIGSCVVDGVRNLVTSFSMAKLVGFPTSDSTFTYQKGVQNTSLVDLLLSKGVVDNHSLHKVSHSFSKVVPSERTSIATGVAIVDNTGSAIQVRGHTPRVVLLDTGAQPVILGVQFAKKMGMLDSKLQKSMWQIRTASESVEEVLGESSDLIALKFNEGTDKELCL
jgi:hypothetical protein